MDYNQSGYFAYKKKKIQSEMREVSVKRPISKLNFLFQLFLATFLIMFVVIVVTIMKYSSKMDIEYAQGEIQQAQTTIGPLTHLDNDELLPQQRKIDKRLRLIQQEENAPSEAKIVDKNTNYPKVIEESVMEETIKQEKIEKIQKQNEIQVQTQQKRAEENDKKQGLFVDLKPKKNDIDIANDQNVTILSKVLVGRFTTFEEAVSAQNQIKSTNPELSPFVRKVGSVYSVQMGSYQDFNVAQNQARMLKTKGFDVWIYQQ